MTDATNKYELLSKADVIRQYGYPAHLLDADLLAGRIAAFLADGTPPSQATTLYGARYYIVRGSVEERIAALASANTKGKQTA